MYIALVYYCNMFRLIARSNQQGIYRRVVFSEEFIALSMVRVKCTFQSKLLYTGMCLITTFRSATPRINDGGLRRL
jgi:hypothetical protein